ncbi:hypothetical protein IMZ11_31230 [Microtetraspora sp. AC03309]|uniref:hypothetical protein n=1 Tax=Microtetraspora sp. AC03309 TaxID=2779376 RepID=UPI001E2DB456|nr:hypothetical protein [Microtetraspora sp. AC03309]MCC5580107.1 hypothetical protein [Microtetraspora sp. AC03309]
MAGTLPKPTVGASSAPRPTQPNPPAKANPAKDAPSPAAELAGDPGDTTGGATGDVTGLPILETHVSESIPLVVPLPPLAVSFAESCQSVTDAACWSLAPWRGRTGDQPPAAAVAGQGSAAPRWAFAPPPHRIAPARVAPASWGPAPARSGCWIFSPSEACARPQQ